VTVDFLFADPILKHLLVTAITLIAAFLIIECTSHLLNRARKLWDLDLTLIQVLNELVKYTVIFLAVTIILNELGINITGIVISLGIVGIAVGFAARDTLSNFIAGFFILADKGFRVGDIIEISNREGRVLKMGFRITTLKTADNKIIHIPNSLFSKDPYINLTAAENRRVDLDVTIPYRMDLENTVQSLKSAASELKGVLEKPSPDVQIKELSDTGVKATVTLWTNDPWEVATYRTSIAKEAKRILVDENA
jgi:small conductance mechanosensitive channel